MHTQKIFYAMLAAGCLSTLSVWAAETATARTDEPIKPIEPHTIEAPDKFELGKKLFFDPRLSKSGAISCNSCHNLSMGGSDNLPTSIGDHWQQGPINAPTVLNAGHSVAQFWDGRAKDLQEQAGGPIANPKEMAFSHELAIKVLSSIPQYREEFKKVYSKDEITIAEVTDAIAEFEKNLVTPHSKFDLWLRGDNAALNDTEMKGYQLFKTSGCIACHNGEMLGGSSFQKMGVVEPYKTTNEAQGVAGLTKKDEDRFKFKVPTLRNVELTYPYFHDGAATSLEQAVNTMGQIQLGKKFTDEETAQIVAFLKTLTGKQPEIMLPILPPSTNETIRPDPFPKAAEASQTTTEPNKTATP